MFLIFVIKHVVAMYFIYYIVRLAFTRLDSTYLDSLFNNTKCIERNKFLKKFCILLRCHHYDNISEWFKK